MRGTRRRGAGREGRPAGRAAAALLAAASVAAAALLCAAPAAADHDQDAPAIKSNDFLIDTYMGPLIGPVRPMSMGGAYAAIAEKSQGIKYNPAAVAHRAWSYMNVFNYDIGYATLLPARYLGQDLDNDGDDSYNYGSFFIGSVHAALQFDKWGIGTITDFQRFVLKGEESRREMAVVLGYTDVAIGYNLRDDMLLVAAGVRMTYLDINIHNVPEKNALSYLLFGPVLGGLLRLQGVPLRIGLSVAFPVPRAQAAWNSGVLQCADGTRKVGVTGSCEATGVVVPKGITFPWSVRLGVAWCFGKQEWNETWKYKDREYEHSSLVPGRKGKPAWSPWMSEYAMARSDKDRRYVVLSLDIQVTGGVQKGIGVEGFLDQKMEESGGSPTVSVHGGIEAEVWADMLVLRVGAYAEPSRFSRHGYRGHGTFGLDLKLFTVCLGSTRISVKGSAGADLAPDYSNIGFSVGFWK